MGEFPSRRELTLEAEVISSNLGSGSGKENEKIFHETWSYVR